MSDFASPTNSRRHEGVGGKGFQTEDTRGGNNGAAQFREVLNGLHIRAPDNRLRSSSRTMMSTSAGS